jgi:hypothetical protein
MGHFGLPSGSFTVHVHHPEDFLLFRDYDVLQRILDAPLPSSSKLEEGVWGRVVAHGLLSAAWHSRCASSPLAA